MHWDKITSDMYLYGSQILHSTSRGRSFTTVLTLGEGENIRNIVSGGLLGDVVAVCSLLFCIQVLMPRDKPAFSVSSENVSSKLRNSCDFRSRNPGESSSQT